jgi:hypothetical protein
VDHLRQEQIHTLGLAEWFLSVDLPDEAMDNSLA